MDTSALMMPVECDVRVFDELDRILGAGVYDLVTPRAVVRELEKLADGNGTEATAASVGRDLAERCTVVETDADYADDALVELAERGTADYVVTRDGPLRDRLPGKAIGIRGHNQLAIN
ncbi:twitching motility protein PilT [Halomarina oriensis]|uniref:Twitching motility protein PilT n=1 Tax=Halomarina oriensis TaxID=671145 RepID=A0A6B0GQ76_9EURY|nr:twitching motility protein PilT [Halomarina oriensis]